MKKVPIEELKVHDMTDASACHPTLIAFGMTALGKPRTPKDIDRVTGRKPDQLTVLKGHWLSYLHVMDNGLKVENIQGSGFPWFSLLDQSSRITWSEFKAMLQSYYGKNDKTMPKSWNEETYNQWRKDWQQIGGRYARHRTRGTYKETETEVTSAVLKKKLEQGAFVCFSAPGPGDDFHAVGVYGLSGNETWLFNPRYPKSPPMEKMAMHGVMRWMARGSGLHAISA